ncbi:MAG TPA: DUF3592 domain-containing protein [Anaerolineales bacterium]|nr:DUF3592 domain-containing protein [Anaerolineales bacterium]HLO34338.1 DUF3592 domain-containing protein [Anaerolineales bacterium]
MQTKKYSINWENDEPVSFEVDGIAYESLEQVPDDEDREKLATMLDGSIEQRFEEEFKDFDEKFHKEFEAHKKSSVSAEKLILGIFSGVAALMLMIALISSAGAVLKIDKEESAPGRVVEIKQQREYVNQEDHIVRDIYYPVVEFTSRDGRSHSAQMTEGSQSPYYEVGDEVTVQYNPDHPLDARIKSFGSVAMMFILPGITGILGLAFLGAVVAVRRLMPPTEEASDLDQNQVIEPI